MSVYTHHAFKIQSVWHFFLFVHVHVHVNVAIALYKLVHGCESSVHC